MAAHAAELLAPGTRALTHCNAGGLATGGYGSAVGALLTAWERGLLAHVWVDETRPLLQGARLTAWELETAAIPHAVIADSAAASLMARGRGRLRDHRRRPDRRERRHRQQDRHVLARRARAAPRDPALRRRAEHRPSTSRPPTARAIPIEERDPAEVTARFAARNPAFDVTPAALIAAIVTEHGRAPRAVRESLARRRSHA